MKLNQINQTPSFSAKVSNERYLVKNKNSTGYYHRAYTDKQITDSYDNAIKELERQKASALKLKEVMQSEEVTKVGEKLPMYDTIEIYARYDEDMRGDACLIYHRLCDDFIVDAETDREIRGFFPVGKNGGIDKKGIINWLNTIKKKLDEAERNKPKRSWDTFNK